MTPDVASEVEQAIDQALVSSGTVRSVAEMVVEEEDITKFDFITFRSELSNRGFNADVASEVWDSMRDDGAIPDGDDEDHPQVEAEEEEDGRFSGDGIPVELPEWAMEPWDVALEPMGAGELFGQGSCEGDNTILWNMADPDEADTLGESGEVTGANTRSGGMFDTEWAQRPDGTAFNAMVNDGLDGGALVGVRACMVDGSPQGDEWDEVNDNRWSRDGGYSTKETVAFQVQKAHSVPDDAPMMLDVVDEEEILARAGVGSGADSTSESQIPAELDGDWSVGDDILITQPGCPACAAAKERDSISDALASGELIEVTPDHPDWDTILDQTGIDYTPGLASLSDDGFVDADFATPEQPAGKV